MVNNTQPHPSYEGIRDQIRADFPKLSKRLQDIAKFALDHPTDIAIETIATISERAGVQPSALIRFSKAFGYSGFTEMQRAFQSRVLQKSASYKERVRGIELPEVADSSTLISSLVTQFCDTNICSLEELMKLKSSEALESALSLLQSANNIYVTGQRRSFPVATYLAYALNHTDSKAFLLDGVGGMAGEHARTMRSDDLLFAITYYPYARETSAIIDIAKERNVPILLLTDSSLCPSALSASVCLEVQDAEVHSFKALTASLCVSQVLATALAFKNKDTGN